MPDRAVETHWQPEFESPAGADVGDNVIYAIGDIHGCYDLALALLEAIAADIASLPPSATPLIVFCGDYIDRGPRSADVLSMILWMRRKAPCDVVLLKGNHEDMLLAFLDNPRDNHAWLLHGGEETLRSYGVAIDLGEPFDERCDTLRDALLDRLPCSHHDLLRHLSMHIVCGDYVIVHAGFRPGVPLDQQSDEDCMWIRRDFLEGGKPFEKIVVHGHSWHSREPDVTPTRIGIDTGAYQTGVLTAVRLVASTAKFLQAVAADPAA